MKCLIKKKKSSKIVIVLMVILISLFSITLPSYTFCATNEQASKIEELNSAVVQELNEIDFSGFNKIIEEFKSKNTNLFSIDNIKNKIYSIVSGENSISYSSFFASIFSNIIEMIIKYLPIMSIIIAIGVVSNLLNGIKSKFNDKSTSNIVSFVCLLSSVVLIVGIISSLSQSTGNSISSMVTQMNILFPILLTLMVGIGATNSVGVFQPIVAIMTTYTVDIFNFVILPLFLFSFVFGVIGNLNDNVKLDKFSSFISSLFKWSIGIIFTLFFAIMTVQGISAGSFDSVSIRTTKYTIKSYVPFVGGYLSDGMDLILSSSILIKNSIGLVGVLMIVSTIISPLLEIVIFSLMLKLVSAILQPMGNSKMSNFLSSTSKSVTMLSTCIIVIGFMYLISVGLIMTASNVVI